MDAGCGGGVTCGWRRWDCGEGVSVCCVVWCADMGIDLGRRLLHYDEKRLRGRERERERDKINEEMSVSVCACHSQF